MPNLAKIIEYTDAAGDAMAVRFPRGDEGVIEWGSQLIVQGDQVAVFFRDGKPMVTFKPGRYVLTTQNVPILTKFITGFVYGKGQTPFRATVYYVSTKLFRSLRWGTPSPINFADPMFMNIPVRANGMFSVEVAHPAVFVNKIVGTQPLFRTSDIEEYLRSFIVTAVQDTLGELAKPFQELSKFSREVVIGVKSILADEFRNSGLELKDLTLNPLTTTPEVQAAIDKMTAEAAAAASNARKIEMELAAKARGAATLAGSGGAAAYQQFQMGDAMVAMANRPGGSGANPMDTGVNLGLAMMMPQMMQNMMKGQAGAPGAVAVEAQAKADPVAKLKQIKELLDAGIITPEEYEAKKAEWLKQL